MALKFKNGIAKDGNVYRCRIVVKGQVFKATHATLRDAREFVEACKAGRAGNFEQLTRMRDGTGTKLDEIVETLVDELAATRKNLRDQRSFRSRIHVFQARFGRLDVGMLKVAEIIAWATELREAGRAASTVKHYLDDAVVLLDEAHTRALLPDGFANPVRDARTRLAKGRVKIIGNGEDAGRRVSQDEIDDLCRVADPVMGAAIRFAVASAFRAGEVAGLTWGDIDFDTHVCTPVNQKAGKNDTREKREAPMTPEMESILRAQLPKDTIVHRDAPVFPRCSKGGVVDKRNPKLDQDSISQRFAYIRAKAGLEHIRFHDLRHEGCSRLGETVWPGIGYLPAERIMEFSGHKTHAMVARYVKANVATFAATLHAGAPKGDVVKLPGRKQA